MLAPPQQQQMQHSMGSPTGQNGRVDLNALSALLMGGIANNNGVQIPGGQNSNNDGQLTPAQQQQLAAAAAAAAAWGAAGRQNHDSSSGSSSNVVTTSVGHAAPQAGIDPRTHMEIFESSHKTISQGATIIPCKARGISKDHNEKVS